MGEAIVRRLKKDGHAVVFTYHARGTHAEKLAGETGAEAILFDIRDRSSVDKLAARISEESFDGLVNTATSPIPSRELFTKTDPDQFIEYITGELSAVVRLSHAFVAKAKKDAHAASIVNMLTAYTLGMPPANLSAYVTLKYAMLGLTRSLATDLAPHNIRVNAVSPSIAETRFTSDIPKRWLEMEAEASPMMRLVTPEDVAGAVAFLLSPEAGYITGVNIPVAGGGVC